VVGDLRGAFQRTPILQIGLNACRPEGMIADVGIKAGITGPPLQHGIGKLLDHPSA
jgi:hypothetical protein